MRTDEKIRELRRVLRELETGAREDGFTKTELRLMKNRLDRAERHLEEAAFLVKSPWEVLR